MSAYTDKLENAIIDAHNAGDTEGAQMLANELKTWQPSAKDTPIKAKNKLPELTAKDRFMQGLKDPIDAGAQVLTHILPEGLVNAGNKFNNFLADKTGLVGKLPVGGIDQQITQNENNYQAQRSAQGQDGIDFARMGGNVLSPMNLAIASKIPAGASIGQRILSGVAGGAGLNATTQPVVNATSDNFTSEKVKQAAVGGVSGGIFNGMTAGVSRVISPNSSVNPQLQLLKSEGVNPTIGQTLGGGFNRAEEALSSVPILGSMVGNARNTANAQFEAAAHNRALSPIGDKLPDGLTGRDAINYTETALKNNYDRVLNNIGAIKPDEKFNQGVAALQDKAKSLLLPRDRMNDVNRAISDIKNSVNANGYMTSDAYKTLESTLGKDAQTLSSMQDPSANRIAPAVKQVQQELKDMLQRQAGSSADELKATNAGWANFKRVQKTSAALGADEGSFTPAQFQNSVKALDKSKDKGAFSRGSALAQDLGDAGKSILGNKVRDSGTPERLLLTGGALGAGAINPAITAGILGGSALYTQPGQRLLNALVSSRPDSSAQLAEFLRQNSKYILPASGAIGQGLLN